jgi:hypothetical protein
MAEKGRRDFSNEMWIQTRINGLVLQASSPLMYCVVRVARRAGNLLTPEYGYVTRK